MGEGRRGQWGGVGRQMPIDLHGGGEERTLAVFCTHARLSGEPLLW